MLLLVNTVSISLFFERKKKKKKKNILWEKSAFTAEQVLKTNILNYELALVVPLIWSPCVNFFSILSLRTQNEWLELILS